MGVPSPPPTPQQKRFQYFLGLGLGFIPLILFFIGFAPNIGVLIIISLILYVVVLIATIVCTIIESVRSVGYGLLTAFLVSPFVAAIGCIVIISQRTA